MASLNFHRRDQRWRLVEYLGRDAEGRTKCRSKNFASLEEATAYADAAGIEICSGGRRTADQVIKHLAANSATTETGCQVWIGELTNVGYGRMDWVDVNGFTQRGAHRVAYTVLHAPVPTDLVVDHLCRVRACIRLDHLEVVTQQVNVMRSPIAPGALNALKTHCPQGHAYTPENTYSTSKAGRVCRTCTLARNRRQKVGA